MCSLFVISVTHTDLGFQIILMCLSFTSSLNGQGEEHCTKFAHLKLPHTVPLLSHKPILLLAQAQLFMRLLFLHQSRSNPDSDYFQDESPRRRTGTYFPQYSNITVKASRSHCKLILLPVTPSRHTNILPTRPCRVRISTCSARRACTMCLENVVLEGR